MNTFLKLRFGGRVWLKLRFVQRFPMNWTHRRPIRIEILAAILHVDYGCLIRVPLLSKSVFA